MGSDPQYTKYPDLSLAQDIFNLSNPACAPALRHGSLRKLQSAIEEKHMAPLYRHLAHPTEGILNSPGEGGPQQQQQQNNTSQGNNSNNSKTTTINSSLLASRRPSQVLDLAWDEKLYDRLVAENKKELEALQKEEDEAAEAAGETEVQAAKGKRAEFWARVGDKVGFLS